uniref:Uncharacterized protein n=1 Tax=Pipistrellus kuhlii TaxID=59472 RepID=A0A7J7VVB1_PIPKU|nr:hypothetical protein mPipKuh1_008253 [Pipistrellus kuhlii]
MEVRAPWRLSTPAAEKKYSLHELKVLFVLTLPPHKLCPHGDAWPAADAGEFGEDELNAAETCHPACLLLLSTGPFIVTAELLEGLCPSSHPRLGGLGACTGMPPGETCRVSLTTQDSWKNLGQCISGMIPLRGKNNSFLKINPLHLLPHPCYHGAVIEL